MFDYDDSINVTWAPMLVGKVQFRRASNRYVPLYKAELLVREVFMMNEMENMNCTTLLKAIKSHEHPGWDDLDMNSISDTMKEDLKFFTPKWMTAFEWSLDQIDETLETYFYNGDNDGDSNK